VTKGNSHSLRWASRGRSGALLKADVDFLPLPLPLWFNYHVHPCGD